MKSIEDFSEQEYANHRRKKYLHIFKKIAEYQKEIQKLQDKVIRWILKEKRKEDKGRKLR